MKTLRFAPALALIAATLGASAALAHNPRARAVNPAANPIAAIDALGMPGLAPARALLREAMGEETRTPSARNRVVIVTEPEVPSRRLLPLFGFGWWTHSVVLHRTAPGCDLIHTRYGGTVETCVGPVSRSPLTPRRVLPLTHDW